MTERPSAPRRLAAALLGVERRGRSPADIAVQRRLPFGRRLLASVLGIRVRAEAPSVPAPVTGRTERVREETRLSASSSTSRSSGAAPRAVVNVGSGAGTPEPEIRPRITAVLGGVSRHLLTEDRPDYEQILDEALRSAPHRPELAAVGQRLNPEQLRTMALNATGFITAAAATEYEHYVHVRQELRESTSSVPESASVGEAAESAGVGVLAVLAVLFPVLAGTAAAVFLLVGYILKMLSPEPALAQSVITTGWVFGAMTAAAILVAAVGLVLTALRNGPSPEARRGELPDEVARAREAWRAALLERGILPFLREALADSATPAASARPGPTSRVPSLGYDRPGFTSPGDDPASPPRPSFTSPDFTSPDFGGPEQEREQD